MSLKTGKVQIYTGPGKGKTTAAFGLAFRAMGHGLKVRIIQFMKAWPEYGEFQMAQKLDLIEVYQFGTPDLVIPGKAARIDYKEAEKAINKAHELIKDPDTDILILDEINVACWFGLIKPGQIIDLIAVRPEKTELILTGRNAHESVLEKADLITTMTDTRHYYDTQSLEARKGIEL
jgi:cob(I)alamin adenosyltransferase